MTAKQVVLDVLAQVPEECSWDELDYQLYQRRAIQEGLECASELGVDEVRQCLRQRNGR